MYIQEELLKAVYLNKAQMVKFCHIFTTILNRVLDVSHKPAFNLHEP